MSDAATSRGRGRRGPPAARPVRDRAWLTMPDAADRPMPRPPKRPTASVDGGPGPAAPRPEASVEELIADLERITAERDDYLDRLRRSQAEFENYRKRMAKQQADDAARATERLVDQLLPVLDACDGAMLHGAKEVEPIFAALLGALEKQGLVRIDPGGEPFDPNQHDAVMHEPAADGDEGTVVSDVMRPGYGWNGRDHPPGHGQGPGLGKAWSQTATIPGGGSRWHPSASGSTRTTTPSSACPRPPSTRRSPAPTASWPGRTTPTPSLATPPPRNGSRRSRRPTTSSATTSAARSTTRSGPWAPWPASVGAARPVPALVAASVVPGGSRSAPTTSAAWGASEMSSATCSVGAAAVAAGAGAPPAHSAAGTWRRRCTSTSSTPSTASPPPSTW